MRGRKHLVPKVLELEESDNCDIEQLEEIKSERIPPLMSFTVHPSIPLRPFGNLGMIDVDRMTYEELLELEEFMGKVSKGLNKEQIAV